MSMNGLCWGKLEEWLKVRQAHAITNASPVVRPSPCAYRRTKTSPCGSCRQLFWPCWVSSLWHNRRSLPNLRANNWGNCLLRHFAQLFSHVCERPEYSVSIVHSKRGSYQLFRDLSSLAGISDQLVSLSNPDDDGDRIVANFAYLTLKNSNFERFARALFSFVHFAAVLVQSTTVL